MEVGDGRGGVSDVATQIERVSTNPTELCEARVGPDPSFTRTDTRIEAHYEVARISGAPAVGSENAVGRMF
jgi:hypothetical protein